MKLLLNLNWNVQPTKAVHPLLSLKYPDMEKDKIAAVSLILLFCTRLTTLQSQNTRLYIEVQLTAPNGFSWTQPTDLLIKNNIAWTKMQNRRKQDVEPTGCTHRSEPGDACYNRYVGKWQAIGRSLYRGPHGDDRYNANFADRVTGQVNMRVSRLFT